MYTKLAKEKFFKNQNLNFAFQVFSLGIEHKLVFIQAKQKVNPEALVELKGLCKRFEDLSVEHKNVLVELEKELQA